MGLCGAQLKCMILTNNIRGNITIDFDSFVSIMTPTTSNDDCDLMELFRVLDTCDRGRISCTTLFRGSQSMSSANHFIRRLTEGSFVVRVVPS